MPIAKPFIPDETSSVAGMIIIVMDNDRSEAVLNFNHMKTSAGLLLYKRISNTIEVFLVHPGGPFWKNKEEGAWSIPKGEFTTDEEPLAAAIREMEEETGIRIEGTFIELEPLKLKTGKLVLAWAIEKDIDASTITSNMIDIEWPPRSGKMIHIPEVDKGAWFDPETALQKINPGQAGFITQLLSMLEL